MGIIGPNSRMRSIPTTGGIRELRALAEEMERQGRSILHFEIGEPDFSSPACAKEAVAEALKEGREHYSDNAGVPELRQALAEKLSAQYGFPVDGEREIVITLGATEAITLCMLSLFEFGDEIIVFSPMYPSFSDQIALAGLAMKVVHCSFDDGFGLPLEELEGAVGPRTRGILVNSPSNPTGSVFTREELGYLADFAKRHDLVVISDECYKDLIYDGEHRSISEFAGMRERTAIVGAASKTYAMTGWRVGWVVVPAAFKKYAQKCHQILTTHAATFVQYGVAAALRCADEDVVRMRDEYRKRRDTFVPLLAAIGGVEVHVPAGSMFLYPRFGGFGMSSMEMCDYLLREAGVSTVPGEAFHSSEPCLRLSFGCPREQLTEGARRIAEALAKLHSNR